MRVNEIFFGPLQNLSRMDIIEAQYANAICDEYKVEEYYLETGYTMNDEIYFIRRTVADASQRDRRHAGDWVHEGVMYTSDVEKEKVPYSILEIIPDPNKTIEEVAEELQLVPKT